MKQKLGDDNSLTFQNIQNMYTYHDFCDMINKVFYNILQLLNQHTLFFGVYVSTVH